MKKRFSIAGVLALCLVTAVITYVFAASSAKIHYDEKLDQAYQDLAPFTKLIEIDDYVRNNYVGEIDDEKLFYNIYQGYFAGIGDRFSMYHTQEEMNAMTMTSEGKLVGIGVIVNYEFDEECVFIRRVMTDSPAENAGLMIGDLIVAVEGHEINYSTYSECIDMIRGEEGTDVRLTVKRDGKLFDAVLTRATVRSQSVFIEYLEDNIAYIQINEFEGNAASDFVRLMKEAAAKNVAGYIFDLRNNPGGDLEIICNILDYLLPEGPIIRVKNSSGQIVYTRDSAASCVDAPMAVLVNESTASAAELFTAAIRDYNKGKIIGTTTFGKGTMQHIVPLSDGSGVRLSCYYYDPPYGENYHGIGITPDVVIPQDEYYASRPYLLNESNDIQIKAAKEELRKTIKGES